MNSKNAGYGKYYPEVDTHTTLTLRGFAKHMSDHGSIYSLDLIEGVLKKITQCLPELIIDCISNPHSPRSNKLHENGQSLIKSAAGDQFSDSRFL